MCKGSVKYFITIIMIFSICISFTISSVAAYSITQLANNGNDDWDPQINNSGEVVSDEAPGNDYEIFFYDGTTIIQLTDNYYRDESPQINNSGEVVWNGIDIVPPSDWGGGGGGGQGGGDFGGFGNIAPCLISTAVYGFRMSKEILTLALLFVSMLIVFHKIREKFKN